MQEQEPCTHEDLRASVPMTVNVDAKGNTWWGEPCGDPEQSEFFWCANCFLEFREAKGFVAHLAKQETTK